MTVTRLAILTALVLLIPSAWAAHGDDGCAGGADAPDDERNATPIALPVSCLGKLSEPVDPPWRSGLIECDDGSGGLGCAIEPLRTGTPILHRVLENPCRVGCPQPT